ncbi:hypothetical protein Tco_1299860, partial [Tanacetum coccineum]
CDVCVKGPPEKEDLKDEARILMEIIAANYTRDNSVSTTKSILLVTLIVVALLLLVVDVLHVVGVDGARNYCRDRHRLLRGIIAGIVARC